jgi:ABC-type multidrug transport system fused ATPase/permease subunit
VVLDRSVIVEEETHASLAASNGIYASLTSLLFND